MTYFQNMKSNMVTTRNVLNCLQTDALLEHIQLLQNPQSLILQNLHEIL